MERRTPAIPPWEDFFRFNSWANQRLLRACQELSDLQLDERLEMGFGSLRGTLFHILAAEEIWLERWQSVPWRPFPMEPQGASLSEIGRRLEQVDQARQAFLEPHRETQFRATIEYRDSRGNAYQNPLDELLVHVANHGIHHRAQALNFLKRFGRPIPVGLDYILYRLAHPSVLQSESTQTHLEQFGLEIAVREGTPVSFDQPWLKRFFAYHDWAQYEVLNLVESLEDAAIDHDFGMGHGSIRKTFMHVLNAERRWLAYWKGASADANVLPSQTTDQLRAVWAQTAEARNAFLAAIDSAEADRIVEMNLGGTPIRFTINETLLQIVCHGTHHRAQMLNMLRHCDVKPPAIDFVVWVRTVS